MPTQNGTFKYGVQFKVNQASLNNITKSLEKIQQAASKNKDKGLQTQFNQAAEAARKLQSIVSSSWNDKLQQLNLNTFNKGLKDASLDLNTLQSKLGQAGAQGQAAFNQMAQAVLNTNLQVKQSKGLLDSMAESIGNAAKWGIASRVINTITSSIRSAFYYSKDLDRSLTNIRMVTGYSADEMQRFAKAANATAKELGRSTLDYTEAAVGFYRQGLSDEDVAARTETTLKAQNITGTGSQMADYLTSVWNGFKIDSKDVETTVDKLAKVADNSASDMSQLAIAMSKVAATANILGVDVDQLTASIATVVATTRQAPESVGTAFKTIFARLNDIKAGADEAEISLGRYSEKMASLGFNVLDANGRLRNTGEVLNQIGSRWSDLTKEQQVYLAQTMGGQRQITQVISLFDNWTTYLDLYNKSLSSQGTLNQKNNIYLEETATVMKQLQAEAQRTYSILFDKDAVNGFSKGITSALKVFNNFIEGIGGGTNTFIYFGSLVANIFNKQITQGIINAENSINRFFANRAFKKQGENFVSGLVQTDVEILNAASGNAVSGNALQEQAKAAQEVYAVQKGLTNQEIQQAIEIQKQIGFTQQKLDFLEKAKENKKKELEDDKKILKITAEQTAEIQQQILAKKTKLEIDTKSSQKAARAVNTINWDGYISQSGKRLNTNDHPNGKQQMIDILEDSRQQILKTAGPKFSEEDFNNFITKLKGGTFEYQEWNRLSGLINENNNKNVKELQAANRAIENINTDLEKEEAVTKQENDNLKNHSHAIAEKGKHVINVQKAMKATFAISSALSSAIGAVGTITQQGTTAAEKGNALLSAFQGTLMGVGAAFGPIGMGIASVGSSLLSAIGLGKLFEKIFKKNADVVKELNQQIKEANKEVSSANANIQSLKDLSDEWETLSAKVGDYGKNLDSLTEEQQDRYHEIVNTFASYNEAIVAGYDKQGNAIIRNQDALRDTITLLEKERKLKLETALGGSATQWGKQEATRYWNYKDEVKNAEGERDRAKTRVEDFREGLSNNIGFAYQNAKKWFKIPKDQQQEFHDYIQDQLGWEDVDWEDWVKEASAEIPQGAVEEYNKKYFEFTHALQTAFDTKAFDSYYTTYRADVSFSQIGDYDKVLADYNDKVNNLERLQQQAEYLTKIPVNDLLMRFQSFDTEEKYNSLVRKVGQDTAKQLLASYFEGWHFGETENADEKMAVANEVGANKVATQYATNYANSIIDIYDTITQNLQKNQKDADEKKLEGSVTERKDELESILQNTLNVLDPKDYVNNKNNQQALKQILLNNFDLSNIQLSFDKNGIAVDSFKIESEKYLDKAMSAFRRAYETQVGEIDQKDFDLEALSNILNPEDVVDFDKILDSLDFNRIAIYVKKGGETVENALKEQYQRIKKQNQNFSFEDVNTFNNLLEKEFKGLLKKKNKGETLKDQELENYNRIIGVLLTRLPELQDQVDILNSTELIGTQAFSDAFAAIDRGFDVLVNEDLENQLQQSYVLLQQFEDIPLTVDDSAFQSWRTEMERYLEADHDFSVSVHFDAQNEFEKLQEELDGLYSAAEKIGKDFIVSAKDIRELNNVFPGIIEGIQWVDDGYAKLNQNVVQGAIATAQTQISSNQEAVVQQLKTQSMFLHQKANNYKAMSEAAAQLAKNQVRTDERGAAARQEISKKLQQNRTLDSQYATLQQVANQKDVADDSQKEASIIANNWAEAASQASNAIYKFAEDAIINQKQVAQGANADTSNLSKQAISSYFQGSSSNREQSLLTKIDKTESPQDLESITSKEWEELSESYRQLYLSYDKNANDVDSMITQLGLKTKQLNFGLSNVNAGKGISPKEEKKTKEKQAKTKDPGTIEYLQEEFDRYHDINIIIQRIGKSLQEVQAEQKKLFGKDLLDNLNKQVALLNQQIQAYEIKLSLAKQEQNELQASLKAQGVIFDSNTGAIANYASALQNKLNGVNAIIAHYNTMSAEQQQGYKDVVEAAKKDYQKFKQQIENYDKIIGETIPSLQKEIRNARDSIIEKQIAKFKMKVQIELDLAEATKQWNEFKKKVITRVHADDIIGNTEALMANYSAYYNQDGGSVQALSNQVNGTLAELNIIDSGGTSSVYGTDKAAAMKDLEDYSGKLMTALTDVQSLIDDVNKAFFDQIAAADKAFSRQSDHYEHLTNEIEHQQKLYTMLYGEEAYDDMAKFYETQQVNNNNELDFLRQQTEFWQAQVDASKNRLNNLEKGSKEWKEESKRLEELEDQWVDSLDQLNSKVEDSVQNLLDKYNNNVDRIFKDAESKLTNGKSLEYIGQEWELINKETEDYLDSVNAIAQIQNFQDAAREAMNSSMGNLKNQKAIRDLMEEQVKLLKDKDKITKYDIDRANMLLQIEIKRQALEDARNNKSKLRLRRDTQGNYTYQYTADQDRNRQAQQEYRQAQVGLYNFDKEAYKENLNDVYSLQTEYFDKLKELYKKYPTWTEQAERERQLLTQHYGTLINDKVAQNDEIRKNINFSTINTLSALYQSDAKNYAGSQLSILNANGETVKKINELYLSATNNLNSLYTKNKENYASNQTSILNNTNTTAEGIKGSYGSIYEAFSSLTEKELNNLNKTLIPGWNSGIQQAITTTDGANTNINKALGDTFKALEKNLIGGQGEPGLTGDLAKLNEAAGTNLGTPEGKNGIWQKLSDVKDKSDDVYDSNKSIIDLWDQRVSAITTFSTELGGLATAYGKVKDAAIAAATAAKKYLEEQKKAAANAKSDQETDSSLPKVPETKWQPKDYTSPEKTVTTSDQTDTGTGNGTGNGGTGNGGGSGAGGGTGSGAAQKQEIWKPVNAMYHRKVNENGDFIGAAEKHTFVPDSDSGSFTGVNGTGTVRYICHKCQAIKIITLKNGAQVGFADYQNIPGYATGAYTGNWVGNDGKLGILHKKELILNQKDTSNMLKAVNITRSIDDSLSALKGNFTLPQILRNFAGGNTANTSNLDQTVHITANFPSVNSKLEIEEAFGNLINRASQYAGRRVI